MIYGMLARTSPGERHRNAIAIVPRLSMRWSKTDVTPDHNVNWPPKYPPRDEIPEEAKVSPIVETDAVPDDTDAAIEIRHARTGVLVAGGTLDGLKVKANLVIDPKTNAPPVFVFNAAHTPWNTWDVPLFYFTVRINYYNLSGETSRDYRNDWHNLLRVLYWHTVDCDKNIDQNPTYHVELETNLIGDIIISGSQGYNHRIYRRPWLPGYDKRLLGSTIRDTYSYHHVGHGTVRCPVDGSLFPYDAQGYPLTCPVNASHPGEGVILLETGQQANPYQVIGPTDIMDGGWVPSVPRYLAYIISCMAGCNRAFADAFIGRGTQYVVAFRKVCYPPDVHEMARQFFLQWCGPHYNCDPAAIPLIFSDVSPPYYVGQRPVLYGAGTGTARPELSPEQSAQKAMADNVAGGALLGDAAEQLLK